jgi:hypothetical protein
MKRFSTLTLGFALVLGATHTTFADPLQWNLSTLTFQGGSYPSGAVSTGTLSGSFTYDAVTNGFATWSIQLSGFPGTGIPGTGLSLTPADTILTTNGFCFSCLPGSFSVFPTPNPVTGIGGPLFNFSALALSFSQPLTDAGGTVPLDRNIDGTVLILDLANFGSFGLQSPGGSATAVPEPSSAALVLLVSVGFGGLFLRRLRHSRPKS